MAGGGSGKDDRYGVRRRKRRSGGRAAPDSNELIRAIVEVVNRWVKGDLPDSPEVVGRRMVRESGPSTQAMTEEELLEAGERISLEEARPKRASSRGSGPGRWLSIALSLASEEARRWRHVPKSEAEKAQSNITNKRRRDGRDRRGRWKTPIFANLEPEPDGDGYVLMLANDPERDVRE